MKGLREKFQKNGGFTLIEMLIVVAIIAILIAVSIPMISNALERAKIATDEANERSAMATALIEYMTTDTPITADTTYYYKVDNTQGSLEKKDGGTAPTGYGQCKDHVGSYIEVTITKDGDVSMAWAGGTGTGDPHLYTKTAP